jgi:catechol 2,3-dioxygenase-like lactoylglutathione lyase family enzyme
MALSNSLNIKANHVFFYYQNLPRAQKFYEETLGLKRVLDYGFASIHQISRTTFVGLVDEAGGMHKTTETKSVTLSFISEEVDAWYQYLTGKGVGMHRPLKDATRHPTRGFVARDPEGYFLEFETFLQHEQNMKLQRRLKEIEAIYPLENQTTTRPGNLGVQGNIIWLYYKDLPAARRFYEETIGLDLVVCQSFAKVYSSSKTGYIGLVDEAQGLHRFSEEKSVTVSFFTDDVKSWFSHFKAKSTELHSQSITIESDAVEYFVAYDIGGYYLEFDQFLEHARNQEILRTLKVD